MTPQIQTSEINLGYPLWACDFDPRDPTRLVVGGGGGIGGSGVANKIVCRASVAADYLCLHSFLSSRPSVHAWERTD